jgi:hypothetical protein
MSDLKVSLAEPRRVTVTEVCIYEGVHIAADALGENEEKILLYLYRRVSVIVPEFSLYPFMSNEFRRIPEFPEDFVGTEVMVVPDPTHRRVRNWVPKSEWDYSVESIADNPPDLVLPIRSLKEFGPYDSHEALISEIPLIREFDPIEIAEFVKALYRHAARH